MLFFYNDTDLKKLFLTGSFFITLPVLPLPPGAGYFRVMGETISLKEVLAYMDSGRKFSISFITADTHKDTGGELIVAEQAHKHNWLPPAEYKKQMKLQPAAKKLKKDPRHYENSTRNIILPGSEIRKVHIRLIRKFNGKTVL